MRRLALILIALPMLACAFGPQVREMMLQIASRDDLTPPPTDGLVAYWSMRTSGTTVYDEHGSHNGVINNNLLFGEDYGVRSAGAYNLTRAEQWIDFANNNLDTPLKNGSFTISAWAYPGATGSEVAVSEIISRGLYSTGSHLYGMRFFVSGAAVVFTRNVGQAAEEGYLTVRHEFEVSPQFEWVHAVVTYNKANGVVSIYINKEKVAEQTTSTSNVAYYGPNDVGYSLFANRRNVSDGYSVGRLDEVRIYEEVLIDNDITILYNWDKEGAGH